MDHLGLNALELQVAGILANMGNPIPAGGIVKATVPFNNTTGYQGSFTLRNITYQAYYLANQNQIKILEFPTNDSPPST